MCNTDPKIFWSNVAKVLFEKGISWSTLADLTGLSAQSIASAKYLNSQLTVSTIIRISMILGKMPSELFESQEINEDPSDIIIKARETDALSGILMLLPTLPQEVQRYIIFNAKNTKGGY